MARVVKKRSLKFLKFKISKTKNNLLVLIKKRPFVSFFITLGLLLIMIVLGSLVFKPAVTQVSQGKEIKEVKTYKIGKAPKMVFQGEVEKSGVIKIVSQTSGIIQSVNVEQGQKVDKGANLINIATNYQGGNAAETQAAIANKQYQFNQDTFNTQKEIISKQRDLTNLNNDNANKLRDISSQSLNDTSNLINLNNDILNTLDQNLNDLEANNSGGANDAVILQTKEVVSQVRAGQNQLLSAQRNLQYTTNTDNAPQKIIETQKDLALKQLDIQEKSLQLNKDISQLQLSLAAINAALFHPVAPFSGTVDRIFARVGQSVNSGTPLISLSGENKNTNIIVRVPLSIVNKISRLESSNIIINGNALSLVPTSVSTEATDGQLYAVVYAIPAENNINLTDGSFVNVEIPIGIPDTNAAIPLIPLDAVYQTEQEALVYLAEKGIVVGRDVKLGEVLGGYVQIPSGLKSADQVILNRIVIAGDKVNVTNN